jgi:hypothetical protein
MTRRSQGLPDEVLKKFTVSVSKLRTREPVTADNQHNPDGFLAAADMMVDVSYVGVMRRFDSKFSLHLEWVDLEGGGHRVEFPHELVERIISVHSRIIDEAKSQRARNVMAKRMSEGYIPNFAKRKNNSEEGLR